MNILDGTFTSKKLQVGANANQTISVSISALIEVTSKALETHVSGATAQNAIASIQSSITKLSTLRSKLGAIQNRLEHTVANLDNISENTQSAESRIRDTDMAEEMVQYSKNNILQQAGQSMLAQANQANQGVLSLLQ